LMLSLARRGLGNEGSRAGELGGLHWQPKLAS
jgi:hypothetical protein